MVCLYIFAFVYELSRVALLNCRKLHWKCPWQWFVVGSWAREDFNA